MNTSNIVSRYTKCLAKLPNWTSTLYTMTEAYIIHEIYYAIIKAIGLYMNVYIVSHDNAIRLAPWLEKRGFTVFGSSNFAIGKLDLPDKCKYNGVHNFVICRTTTTSTRALCAK